MCFVLKFNGKHNMMCDLCRFWFGSDYEERCAGVLSVECLNLRGSYDNSIASLMLAEDDNLEDLDRFLYVEYASRPCELQPE